MCVGVCPGSLTFAVSCSTGQCPRRCVLSVAAEMRNAGTFAAHGGQPILQDGDVYLKKTKYMVYSC